MNLLNPPPPRPLHPGLFLHQTPGGPDYSLADPRLQGWDREAQEEGKVLHPACVGRVGRGTRQVSPWACVSLGAGPISPAHPSIVPGGGTSSACPPLLLFCPNPGTWGLCSPTKAKQEGPPHPRPCSLSVLCPQIPAGWASSETRCALAPPTCTSSSCQATRHPRPSFHALGPS